MSQTKRVCYLCGDITEPSWSNYEHGVYLCPLCAWPRLPAVAPETEDDYEPETEEDYEQRWGSAMLRG